ncbi:MAG TPA: hypothetical protein VN132_10310, partial [Bdellovibrio sp.]|nr:hypothetical protein [Bdellovibrio sp.]
MKLHKHVLATVLSSSLLWAAPFSAHAGFFDFLEPANLSQKMKNLIAKQKVSGSVNIFDVQIYDGLSAALKYKIQSEPSYVDGYYTRFDRYTLDADAKPGDMIGGNDLPIGFEIDSNSEIIFARQFKKQSDTFTALPYTAKNLPLSAEQAIKNLNPGDFVAFNGKLSAVLSLNASSPIGGSIATASASTHVYITGQFMIHTFRMPNNKLRLKLIALRSKGVGVNAGVNFGDFKIVGLKIIDNRIKSRINLDPVNFGLNKDGTGLFMLDYVFDLNNAQAAQSYNDLIHTKTKFKDLTFINPLDKDDTIKNDILSDLAGVEDIVNQDYKLPPAQRRVDRIFKGSNDSSSISSSFKFGLNVLRFEQGSTYAQNKVVHIDRDETEQHYILDTFQTSSKIKVLLGLFGDEAIVSANMLFSTDDNWKIQKPVAVTLGREIKMTNVSRRDFEKIQEHVKSVIPADEYAKIDWKNWDFSHGDRVNGSFKNEIFFQPDALKFFRKLSDDEAYDLLVSFIRANG